MFEYEHIGLRPIEREDVEFLRIMHNDWSTLQNLTDTTLINEIQQEKWFTSICSSTSSLRLAVVDIAGTHSVKEVIGCVRLDHIDYRNRSIQVGGDIVANCRGRGFGSLMFKACLKYVFDVMNMRRAYLSVLETNEIAKNMYLKNGFVEEGRQVQAIFRNGLYYDYINMYLLVDKYRESK